MSTPQPDSQEPPGSPGSADPAEPPTLPESTESAESPEPPASAPAPEEPARPSRRQRRALRDQHASETGLPDAINAPGPTPPPKPGPERLIGAIQGILITPVAIVAFVTGIAHLGRAAYASTSFTQSVLIGTFSIILGVALLSVLIIYAGKKSATSLSFAVAWPLALTALAGPLATRTIAHNASGANGSFIWTFLQDLMPVSYSAFFPALAIVLAGCAIASHRAREAGRTQATRDHQAQADDTTQGAPPVPPSRRRDQIMSLVISVAGLGIGLLCLTPLHDRITAVALHEDPMHLPTFLHFGLPLLGITAMLLAAMTLSRSSMGLPLAGLLVCLIPGVFLMFAAFVPGGAAASMVNAVATVLGRSLTISGPYMITFGMVLMVCGSTAVWARKSGYASAITDLKESGA
ncbi:MAG: hypothetical protein Q4G30_08945 [Actinomycetaceae bacterium]|nr:hypothetical protein [Actinomycetaceae bacterium]